MKVALIAIFCIFFLINTPCFADCTALYDEAIGMLQDAKHRGENNLPLNAQEFMDKFNPLMGQLQSDRCSTEIIQLLKYVQDEQRRLSGEGSKPPGKLPATTKPFP